MKETDKKRKKQALLKEEVLVFPQEMKNIQPIKHDKLLLKKPRPRILKTPLVLDDKKPMPYLSDIPSVEPVCAQDSLFFARPGLSHKQIRTLKQGGFPITATLDLHGYDALSAQNELLNFIECTFNQNKRYLKIIHGKGHSDLPVLKNRLNNWLPQIETVLAFCSALPRDGGQGAVYVLLKAVHKKPS